MNVVKDDSGIQIRLTLMEGDTPIDLTNATVSAVFSNGLTRTVKAAEIIDPLGGTAKTVIEAAETAVIGILDMQIQIGMFGGSRFSSEIEHITVMDGL
jgi:hypothetical protein